MTLYRDQYKYLKNTLDGSHIRPTYVLNIFGEDGSVYLSIKNGNVIQDAMSDRWLPETGLCKGCHVRVTNNRPELKDVAGYKGIVESMKPDNHGGTMLSVSLLKTDTGKILKNPEDVRYKRKFLFPDDFAQGGGLRVGW